jgi:hypothetical protein
MISFVASVPFGGTIGDIHIWFGREVIARSRHSVLNAASLDRVECIAEINCSEERARASPAVPAIKGLDQNVRSESREAEGELVAKEIDHPVAVGPNRASRNAEVVDIIGCGSDLLLCPGVAAICRGIHHERRGNCPASTAIAGSFCLFWENGEAGLPTVTSVSLLCAASNMGAISAEDKIININALHFIPSPFCLACGKSSDRMGIVRF